MDVLEQIRNQYDTLSKTQKKIANYIQQHTSACCFASLKEFAAATGTTEATVLNFSRKIGCANFLDMKNQLKEGISDWTTPITTEAFSDLPFEELFKRNKTQQEENFALIWKAENEKSIKDAVGLLQAAKKIYCVACDFSSALSQYFHDRFIRLGLNIENIGNKSTPDILHALAFADKKDLIVVFSFAEYSKMTLAIEEYLSINGIKILCFSDRESGPAALMADVSIICSTRHFILLNSMTSVIILIDLLAMSFFNENKVIFIHHKKKLDKMQRYLFEKKVIPLEYMDPL